MLNKAIEAHRISSGQQHNCQDKIPDRRDKMCFTALRVLCLNKNVTIHAVEIIRKSVTTNMRELKQCLHDFLCVQGYIEDNPDNRWYQKNRNCVLKTLLPQLSKRGITSDHLEIVINLYGFPFFRVDYRNHFERFMKTALEGSGCGLQMVYDLIKYDGGVCLYNSTCKQKERENKNKKKKCCGRSRELAWMDSKNIINDDSARVKRQRKAPSFFF